MLSKSKYATLNDLYTVGTELVLKDGSVMFLKIINPFEREEAMHASQVARARFTQTLKDPASEELLAVRGMFEETGRDGAITKLLDAKRGESFVAVLDELRVDEDWRERSELVLRGDDLMSPPTPEQKDYQARAETEYRTEMARRVNAVEEHERAALGMCSEDELWEQYREWWLDSHAAEQGMVEYRLTEMLYACRACEGVKADDGTWDHSGCEGHKVRVFDTKDEIKYLPVDLQTLIRDTIAALDIGEREAKNSARQGSSSEPSPLPSEPAESTSSIPEPTSATAPGQLPQLSPTP